MIDPYGRFAIDFHVHTSFSYDCPMPPRLVIELARRRRLAGIAVTDHDTVEGALAVRDANRYPDFLVIPGVEVKSDLGDIIGLYVDTKIESRGFGEVIREIHDKGGLAYVPHPIRTFGAARIAQIHRTYPEIDLWEIYNGRYSSGDFTLSDDAFKFLAIGRRLSGSDAHFPWEIGVLRTVFHELPASPGRLLALAKSATLAGTPRGEFALRTGVSLGAVTKAFKRGEYLKAGRSLAALPWKALKRRWF